MGAPGRGWPRGQSATLALPRLREVVIWNAAPALPAHRRAGGALQEPRGSPLGENWSQQGKSLEPKAGQRRLRIRCPQHLAERGLQRKADGKRLLCAQSFGWRAKAQGKGRRASCDRSLKATPGVPKPTRENWGLLPQRQPRLD